MTSFCEEENTSPGSTQSYSDKAAVGLQPTGFVDEEKSWEPVLMGGWVNKSLKGTLLLHLMRKKGTSPLLKSVVNYSQTCAVTASS